MKTHTLITVAALFAALASAPAFAGDHGSYRHHQRHHAGDCMDTKHEGKHGAKHGAKHGVKHADAALQTVPNTASATEPGHGWQYFADPQTHSAVVISPDGDYYLNQGHGLRWVAAAQS